MRYVVMLCLAYGGLYTVYGVVVKYFLKQMSGMEFLFHSSIPMVLGVVIVLSLGWPARLKKKGATGLSAKLHLFDYGWIIWSGVCTGFVVPTTSLMYTFGFSVSVAMIIMRNMLIIASPGVDAILILQGHSKKKVRWQEYAAVLTSICALIITVFGGGSDKSNFEFFRSPAVMITMAAYIIPYALRLYIMSRFKTKVDGKGFMAVEQIWAFITAFGIFAIVLAIHKFGGWSPKQVVEFAKGLDHPSLGATLWSVSYVALAFPSVFLYLYKYGSATFNTTVNRLTSLVAGTASTLVFHYWFGGKSIKNHEWMALVVTFVALGLAAWAGMDDEKERKAQEERLKLKLT